MERSYYNLKDVGEKKSPFQKILCTIKTNCMAEGAVTTWGNHNTSHKFWDKSPSPHYQCCLQVSETVSWHKLQSCYSSNMLQHWVGGRDLIYFCKGDHSRIFMNFSRNWLGLNNLCEILKVDFINFSRVSFKIKPEGSYGSSATQEGSLFHRQLKTGYIGMNDYDTYSSKIIIYQRNTRCTTGS